MVITAIILLGALGVGGRAFLTPQVVSHKITTRAYASGSETPLRVTFRRDLCKASPLKLTKKKGSDAPPALTIFNPTLLREVLRAPAPAVPQQCAADAAKEAKACAQCCDLVRAPWHAWSEKGCACRSVLGALNSDKRHRWVAATDVERMLSDFDLRVYLSLTIDPELAEPFVVSTTQKGRYLLTLASKAEGLTHKAAILARLHATGDLSGVTAGYLGGKIDEAHRRPFGLLFAGLLILGGFVILRLSGWFKRATRGAQIGAILATLGLYWGLVGGLFAGGYISVIAVFVMGMVSPTVLALYVIDHEGGADKFWDHFRFLLMIFIYSGFWVLYFQMFDSVLLVRAGLRRRRQPQRAWPGRCASSLSGSLALRRRARHGDQRGDDHLAAADHLQHRQEHPRHADDDRWASPWAPLGMAILAFSTGIWVFMAGIAIFSVGEMTAHPKFISYVGPDRAQVAGGDVHGLPLPLWRHRQRHRRAAGGQPLRQVRRRAEPAAHAVADLRRDRRGHDRRDC